MGVSELSRETDDCDLGSDFSHCVQIGIIGGSGLDDPDILEGRTEKHVDTPFGKVGPNET